MDEILARVGLVGGALVVAGAVALILRRRSRAPELDRDVPGFAAGLYLFSSTTCSTCESARNKLTAALGEHGFTEFVWEEEPQVFSDLEIAAVPAVLVVAEAGRGRLYPGQPDEALAAR